MNKWLVCFLGVWMSVLTHARETPALQVKEYTLNNGFTVWLNEDASQPLVFGAVVVKAGSKDCPDTGIAHYFEHMMFKGTDKIGTLNYVAEKVYLDSISDQYDLLSSEKDTEKRLEIQKKINRLSIEAARYAIPNEFSRLITRYGGNDLNAGTSYDYTVYQNTFAPQYITQWLELYSERLINPVFRFFQSELETVYEEKNLYSDVLGMSAIEKITQRYFSPHPYMSPIIGTTENLKNPQLSKMKDFYNAYYVSGNMGLILSGNFKTDSVLPLIENYFSRLKRGDAPARNLKAPELFKGRESEKFLLPVPVVKMMAIGWRGVSANHPDALALDLAVGLLSNDSGIGYLDELSASGKIMEVGVLNESLNDAGILGLLVVPKLMFQSYGKVESLLWDELNRIKKGDFQEESLNNLKTELKRKIQTQLEDISARSNMMISLFSQGRNWDSYLSDMNRIDSLTKEDVINVANKYFSSDYLVFTKKTGRYPKENIVKPPFESISPQNTDSESAYAQSLKEIPIMNLPVRLIDFNTDFSTDSLGPLTTLYVKKNPVNEIFHLDIDYKRGLLNFPGLKQVADYLSLLGTDSLTYSDFKNRLQALGATLDVIASDDHFTIRITGFDNHFDSTLVLVGRFISSVKADEDKMDKLIDTENLDKKAFAESSHSLSDALFEYVKYGDKSKYLTQMSLSEVKRLKGSDLVFWFNETTRFGADIHYSGILPVDRVASVIRKNIDLTRMQKSDRRVFWETKYYDKPKVFFINDPKATQSIIYGYIQGGKSGDTHDRLSARLFNSYFGGDMSSLLFQEIREFRSLSYVAQSEYVLPKRVDKEGKGVFVTFLTTQTDKTQDAITVLDSLISDIPVKELRFPLVKQALLNEVNNSYPSFRDITSIVSSLKEQGYTEDPNKNDLEQLDKMQMNDILHFYRDYIKGRPVCYLIVGNEKKLDLKKLASFGTLERISPKSIYR